MEDIGPELEGTLDVCEMAVIYGISHGAKLLVLPGWTSLWLVGLWVGGIL